MAGKKPSATFTALIWFGMFLAAAGMVIAILGVGGAIEFSAKADGAEIKTTSLGLAILAIGCLLSGVVATRLPKGVSVFAVSRPTPIEWIVLHAAWFIALAVVASALVAVSIWRG